MPLKLFLDFMSQPSRAVYIFLKLNKIPFELQQVALRKGEHLAEDFKAKNRFQKVPFIHHGEFKLAESIAIVRYLSREYNIDNNWYPKESKEQARVDEYLEWQHNNTRMMCALYFWHKCIIPIMTGHEPSEASLQKHKDNMITCLDTVENIWLSNSKYLAGDRISVADIFAACEIEQTRMAGYEPSEGRPLLKGYLERVRKETNPFYDEAHQIVNKVAQKAIEKERKSKL